MPTAAFSLSADFDPKRYERDITLVARATGLGILSQSIKPDDATVTLRMPAEVVIHGRLLTPGGSPAQGVRVTLNGFYNDQQPEEVCTSVSIPRKRRSRRTGPHHRRPMPMASSRLRAFPRAISPP